MRQKEGLRVPEIPHLDAVNRGSGLLRRAHHLGHIARLLIGRLVVRDQNDGAAAFTRRASQVERRVIQRIVEGGAAIGAEAKPQTAAESIGASGEPSSLQAGPEYSSLRLGLIAGVQADSGPGRSESAVGALMAWAGRLWAVTYISNPHPQSGSGTGLYVIDENLHIQRLHVSNGTYANRMLHAPSNQIIIGPYVIDMQGNVRIIEQLVGQRLTSTMKHLHDDGRVYMLTMEGQFYELDIATLQATKLYDLVKEFSIKNESHFNGGAHFKGGYTNQGRVVVANNTFMGPGDADGKLAEWDGKSWNILENKPFMEVASRYEFDNVIFATGWDESSAILKALIAGKWHTYRLPKASHTFDQYWQTEWTRIREVETERYLMDCHGMFYELSPVAFYDSIWGVRPISTHLRVVPDFCSYRGLLALAGNQATPVGNNLLSPQAQSGIWFGKTDDLWSFGKPSGWGGPWRDTPVGKDEPSDPFLMFGFDQKVLHLTQTGASAVEFKIEVDILGNGCWQPYEQIRVSSSGYSYHVFPSGFTAHWVRLVPTAACKATAVFMYS